jgi:hypothetical protein
MSNPTTPFGWQMPTATDLVTDLPADFEVFGQAVATSMADLLGGTTGQVLSKTSATDMDFTWVAPTTGDITGVTAGTGISGGGTSGDVTVTNSMATALTTKGDLTPATGSAAFARLGVGANNTVLTADSAAATGLKWATPTSGGMTLLSTTTLSGTSTTISSIDQTYNNLFIVIKSPTFNTGVRKMVIKPNATSSIAQYTYNSYTSLATSNSGVQNGNLTGLGNNDAAAQATQTNSILTIFNYADTVQGKVFTWCGSYETFDNLSFQIAGSFKTASAISSLEFSASSTGSYTGGTILIYGVK